MKTSAMPKTILRLITAFLFLLVVFLPGLVLAADPAQQTALQNLSDQIMAILLPVVVAAVGLFATWLLAKIKSKFHIDVADSTAAAWSKLAQDSAMRAGEWALQKTKTLEDGKTLPGGDVMEVALNWAIQMAEQMKLPEMAREKLVGLIEAELFKLRLSSAPPVAPIDAMATVDLTKVAKI